MQPDGFLPPHISVYYSPMLFQAWVFWAEFSPRCIIAQYYGCGYEAGPFYFILGDWQVGGAYTHPTNILFFTVLGVLSLFRVYTSNYWRIFVRQRTRVGIFYVFHPTSKHASASCIGLGNSDTQFWGYISNYLCGIYILVLKNLGYFLYFSLTSKHAAAVLHRIR